MRLTVAAALLLLTISGTALAVVKPSHPQMKFSSQLLSQKTHKKLKRVEVLLRNKEYKDALEQITKLEKVYSNRKGDLAKILQYKGFVLAETESYKQSAGAFLAAIDTGGLNKSSALQALELSGQLYLSVEDFSKAASLFESLKLHNKDISGKTLAAMAVAYAQLGQKDVALSNINQALKKAQKPQKNWYELQIALLFEKKDFQAAVPSIKKLIQIAPKEKKYWKQLISASLASEKEKKALAALKSFDVLAEEREKSDLLTQIQLQMSQGEPYFAAERLQQGLDKKEIEPSKRTYTFLAQAWTAAKEHKKAIEAYGKASQFDKSGKTHMLQAQLLLENENWQEAEKVLESAMAKLKKKEQIGKARLLLGISHLQRKSFGKAKSNLDLALQEPKYQKQAAAWLSYMQN